MKNKEKDLVRLKHIFDAITLIEKFSQDMSFNEFEDSLLTQNAIIRQYEIIGEASANISDKMKNNSTNINWDHFKKV